MKYNHKHCDGLCTKCVRQTSMHHKFWNKNDLDKLKTLNIQNVSEISNSNSMFFRIKYATISASIYERCARLLE